MNVFVIGTPFETAKCLDNRRLNKQIIECEQIIKALEGESKAWVNHPCTLQYKDHIGWLKLYMWCLYAYQKYNKSSEWERQTWLQISKNWSDKAIEFTPSFHTGEYLTQMKRRLYTKNNTHYCQWENLGESDINMYNVDGKWRFYRNGKQLKTSDMTNFLSKSV